jgi:hypothetical protein
MLYWDRAVVASCAHTLASGAERVARAMAAPAPVGQGPLWGSAAPCREGSGPGAQGVGQGHRAGGDNNVLRHGMLNSIWTLCSGARQAEGVGTDPIASAATAGKQAS